MTPLPLAILHLDFHETWGGGQSQAFHLMRGLNERGHVQVLLSPPESALGERARGAGLAVVDLPFRAELDPLTTWRVREVVRRVSPDLLHAHDPHALAPAALASRLVRPRPVVVAHRRVSRPIGRNPISRWKWSRGADRVIAVGAGVRSAMIAAGVPTERVRMVHDGIPIEPPPRPRSSVRQRIGAGSGAPVVMTMAALNRAKDHPTLIAAADRLLAREDGARWVVFGEGPLLDDLRDEVERRGLADRLHYLGFDPEARAHLAEADAFALPTRSEGLGTSVIEALAGGVPVVASAAGGVPELVRHEQTGLLVPPGDPAALAAALARILDDRVLARRLAEAGRERARDFAIEETVARTEAVYRDLLA